MLLKVMVTPENESRLQLIPAYAVDAKTQEMEGEQAAELYQFMEGISFGIRIGEEGEVENMLIGEIQEVESTREMFGI